MFIFKKKGCVASWDRALITAAAWCIIIMVHYNSRQQNPYGSYSFFTHSSPCWFITLFLSGGGKGFTYFCCRLWLTFMMLMEIVAAVFLSAHKNCITILILFFISISSWFTLSFKKNGILHHLIDSFLLLLKKKEGLIILIHCDLHHFSDVLLLILHHLSDAFFFFPLKQTGASDLFCTIFVIHFCGILHQYYGAFLPILMEIRLILLIHHISFYITYPMHLFSLKETGAVISSSYWCNFIYEDQINRLFVRKAVFFNGNRGQQE